VALHINSPGWTLLGAGTGRGTARPVRDDLPGLPDRFLASDARVAEEAVIRPASRVRGRSVDAGGAIDLTCEVATGETAVLAVRHASGALTFALPVDAEVGRARGRSQLRFQVRVAQSSTRGIVDKAIKTMVIKVAKAAGDKAVSLVLPRLAEALERATWKRAGLTEGWVRVSKDTLAAGALEVAAPVSPLRSLLFLHGAFSSAASAYRDLAGTAFFDRVADAYGDRIFAFDHFSISRTPVQNARMLLESLPEQTTTFDVVTHGRGGLVLRTIVEGGSEFGHLSSRFKLGHAVLVASPNQGTPLASPQRLHETIGWVANVLEMFPDNPFITGSAFVADALVWLANHALGDLPGLHAMDPDGELVESIQSPSGPPADAYSALVANYHPSGTILHRVLDIGLDQLFGGANDLVMPAEGGWRIHRSSATDIPAARIGCFGPGGNLPGDAVTHVNFFSQARTGDFIVNGLLGRPQPLDRVDPRRRLPDRRLLQRSRTDAIPVRAPRQKAAAARAIDETGSEGHKDALRVSVINGDLTFEERALVLGHYHSTRLTGTEKVVDRLIGGAMSRSLAMGVYPVAVGSHQIFINTRSNLEQGTSRPRPKAVIVAGLGEEGKLRATELVQSVSQAVIAWSQRLAESGRQAPEDFELASTLMGSGGTGISAGQAAHLIAEGVYRANLLLKGNDAADGKSRRRAPRVSHLRFVELFLDRATDAWRSLRLQEEARPGCYAITERVDAGTGGLQRPADLGYRGAEFDFISVASITDADGTPTITYTLDTRRARSEVRGQRTQSGLIREIVTTASNEKNNDPQIGRTLFGLLIPIELEAYMAGSGEMQIELDPQTAAIPWELLDTNRPQGSDLPWAIRVNLLRKLRILEFRERVADAGPGASALVIGEPQCPPQYSRLYGARAEAVAVRDYLSSPEALGTDGVTALISDDPTQPGPGAAEVVNALFKRPSRILHIAGHGALRQKGKPGGVVLSNGNFLGPAEIESMRAVPELVFVNCCHLGAADTHQVLETYDRAHFASGVAGALIKVGVRCVIAAGWAVDDNGARVFAEEFYRSLMRGNRFIVAVGEARRATYLDNPAQNTWAAYQCYGDPDWVFQLAPADANRATTRGVDDFSGIASALSLKLALDRIIVEIRYQGADRAAKLDALRQLETRFGESWGWKGDVGELFGEAFSEAGDVEAAVRWYDKAVTAPDGRAPMRAAEQLANLRGRLGWESVDAAARHLDDMRRREQSGVQKGKLRNDGRAAREEAERLLHAAITRADALIEDSLAMLEKIAALHTTSGRTGLFGSTYKRTALVNAAAGRTAQRDRDLRSMADAYRESLSIAKQRGGDAFYPALNLLVAEVALNAGRGRWRRPDPGLIAIIRASVAQADPDFWRVVAGIELDQCLAMAKRRLASHQRQLEKAYADLHRRVSSTRMWASVYDTACLTLPSYASRSKNKEKRAAQELLGRLRERAHPAAV
jgi:hypothetical protein